MHETAATYSPQSNGKAERLNRTLLNMAKQMLLYVPSRFFNLLWADTINSGNYIRNELQSKNSAKPVTPYELVQGEVLNVSNIRKFGGLAYTHIPKKFKVKNWMQLKMRTFLLDFICFPFIKYFVLNQEK